MTEQPDSPAQQVRRWWEAQFADDGTPPTAQPKIAAAVLHDLCSDGLLRLPQPGRGETGLRFDALSQLGQLDLTVGRLAEAHCDALAILAEPLGAARADTDVWAVWAAELPTARVAATLTPDGGWRISGRKAWCSGAGIADRALVTAHAEDGARLFDVDLRDPAVQPVDDPWPAPALSGTDTRSVDFADAPAVAVGTVGEYVDRPGFWHGAAGVAAVWHGGARAVASRLLHAAQARELGAIDRAHVGAVAAALSGARGVLANAAAQFDADGDMSTDRAEIIARSARAVVEDVAESVMSHVGRALGPGPLALDEAHARRVADLQLYVRQSHGERDLAELGAKTIAAGEYL